MFDKPKKKKNGQSRRRRNIVLGIIAFIGVAMFSCIACIGIVYAIAIDSSYDGFHVLEDDDYDIVQLEERLETSIPDSATNLYGYYWSSRGYSFQVRLDLPASEVSSFLESINNHCFELPLQEGVMPFKYDEKDTLWQPELAEKFSGTECYGGDYYFHLMVDKTDVEIWTVYMSSGAD